MRRLGALLAEPFGGYLGGPRAGGVSAWWNVPGVVAAYQAVGAADATAARVDLTGNGYGLALGVAPTWDAVNGFTFNGTDHYFTTTLIPQDGWSALMEFRAYSGTGILFGLYNSAAPQYARFYGRANRGTSAVGYGMGLEVSVAPEMSTGSLGIAGKQGYRNGVADGSPATGSWDANTIPLYVGCRNSDGTANVFASPEQH